MNFGPLMWSGAESSDREPKYVKVIFDSGAGCTAMPAEVGEGYPIVQDQWTGEKYGGMMEGMQAADEGKRTINFIDEHWKKPEIDAQSRGKDASSSRFGRRDHRRWTVGLHEPGHELHRARV